MSSKSNLDEFLLAKLTADLVVAQHEAKVAAIKAKILALELELREESASGAVLEPVSGLAITALTINSTAEPIIQPQKSPLEAAKPTYAPVSKPPLGPSKALAGITKTSHPHFIHSDIPVLSSDCSKSTGSFDSSTIPPLVQSTIVNDTPSQVHSTKESNDYKPIKVLFKRSGSETKSPNIMGLGSSDTFSAKEEIKCKELPKTLNSSSEGTSKHSFTLIMPPFPKSYPKRKTLNQLSSSVASIETEVETEVETPLSNPVVERTPHSVTTKKRKRIASMGRPKSLRSQISHPIKLYARKRCIPCQKHNIETCEFDEQGYERLRLWMLDAPKGTQWPRGVHASRSSCVSCTKRHKPECLPWDADLYLGEDFQFSHAYRDDRPMYKSNFLTNFFGRDTSGNLLPDFEYDLSSILESAIDPPMKISKAVKRRKTANTVVRNLPPAESTVTNAKPNPSLPSTDTIELFNILYEKQQKQEEGIQRLTEMLAGIHRALEIRNLSSHQGSSLPEFVEGSSSRPLEGSAYINIMDVDNEDAGEDAEEGVVDGLWGEDLEDEETI